MQDKSIITIPFTFFFFWTEIPFTYLFIMFFYYHPTHHKSWHQASVGLMRTQEFKYLKNKNKKHQQRLKIFASTTCSNFIKSDNHT